MNESWKPPHSPNSIEFNKSDEGRFKALGELLSIQDKLVEADTQYRSEVRFSREEFDQICRQSIEDKRRDDIEFAAREERLKKLRGDRGMISRFPPGLDTGHEQRKKAVIDGIKAMLPNNELPSVDFEALEDEQILFRVFNEMTKQKGEFCERTSETLLEDLHERMLEMCDRCFTTSQSGASTATEETKKNPKYDSIYYLYKLSNGTHISQRMKRNLIISEGLDGVIQPIAGSTLFVNKGDGLNLVAGSYDFSQISPVPKESYTLYEYFPENFNSSLREGSVHPKIPDLIRVVEGKVIIDEDISLLSGQYWDIHEGGEVNGILK